MAAKHTADLSGVSETALLTLQVRATEAHRPDGLIDDPMAIALLDAIDFDFAKFGSSRRQDMAIRSKGFDQQTARYLTEHPEATVVALAEGLQTSFWRLDAAGLGHQFRWLTVDLPPVVELREKLLPHCDRVATAAQSALDFDWMDRVEKTHGVFVTAEGLMMYLQPEQAMSLITACAKAFPGGAMMFDLPPVWTAAPLRRGMPVSWRYRIPPMPFHLSRSQAADLARTVPGVRAVRYIPMPPGRGVLLDTALPAAQRIPALAPLLPVWTLLEFG